MRFWRNKYYRSDCVKAKNRFKSWNRFNIVPVRICKICGALATKVRTTKAKRLKTNNLGDQTAMMQQSVPVPGTPPRRIRNQPRGNIQFALRSERGLKRKFIMLQEDSENDPLNTALTAISEEDFEYDPEAGPRNPGLWYRSPPPGRYFDVDECWLLIIT